MIYPFHSIWHLSSGFPVGTCSLCGQAIANGESKRVEVIDGSPYLFDTYSCVAMFSFAHYSDAIISIINESYQKCSIALYGEWGTCIMWLDVNSRAMI